jgi:hypothetical protein
LHIARGPAPRRGRGATQKAYTGIFI